MITIAKTETVPQLIPFQGGTTSRASFRGGKLTAPESLAPRVTARGWR
jgi:hypothetical protein